jgi:arylsulfatase A-like enzyme
VCAPSRTSLLLGVHVPVHGVYENGLSTAGYSTHTSPPFVDALHAQGYTTALIGKAGFRCCSFFSFFSKNK